MADEDADDLYEDIDDSPIFGSSADKAVPTTAVTATTTITTAATAGSASRPRSLVEEVQFLQQKSAKLERENQILKRNMGTLYRTATAELQRKDKEILRLTTEADKAAQAKARLASNS
jgi:hypothetical protein